MQSLSEVTIPATLDIAVSAPLSLKPSLSCVVTLKKCPIIMCITTPFRHALRPYFVYPVLRGLVVITHPTIVLLTYYLCPD